MQIRQVHRQSHQLMMCYLMMKLMQMIITNFCQISVHTWILINHLFFPILATLLIFNSVKCTLGILCGIFQADKMIINGNLTLKIEIGFQEFNILTKFDWVLKKTFQVTQLIINQEMYIL